MLDNPGRFFFVVALRSKEADTGQLRPKGFMLPLTLKEISLQIKGRDVMLI